jgi:hypothetical protein
MDYFEAIEDYLDSENIVSVQWLANELSITLIKSIELLNGYLSKSTKNVAVNYLVIGYDNDDNLSYQLCADVKANYSLKKILSKEIYSIQKQSSENINSLLCDSMLNQAEDIFLRVGAHDERPFALNGLGRIGNSAVKLRTFGERVVSAQNLQFSRTNTMESQQSMASRTSSTKSAPPVKPNTPLVSISTAKPSVPTEPKKNLQAFDAKKPPLVPTSTITKAPVVEENKKRKSSVHEESSSQESRKVTTSSDDDEEWDIDFGSKKRSSSSPQKKQKREDDQVQATTVAAKIEEVSKEKTVQEEHSSPAGKLKSKKINPLARGSMDDFMEDVAIEQYKQEQQAISDNQNVPKKKRVLVEKVSLFCIV